MIAVTRPQGMQLMDWADCVCSDLDTYGPFGKLLVEAEWRPWGIQFFNSTTLGRNLPDPMSFDDWQLWAERFVQGLS